MSLLLAEKFEVSLSRLVELEQKEKELVKAKRLIKLLRAEKKTKKEQDLANILIARNTINQLEYNSDRKYGSFLLAKRLKLF